MLRPESNPSSPETAEQLEIFAGLSLPVSRIPGLLATKVLASDSRRPQDLLDARNLLDVASAAEVEETRGLLRLIEERGFHREKDLTREFEALLRV